MELRCNFPNIYTLSRRCYKPGMDLESIKSAILPVLKRHTFVIKAAVFGSAARGDIDAGSDVDLLMEYQDGTSLLDVSGLGLDLEEALGRKVDLVTPASLKPEMLKSILAQKVDIYERPVKASGRYTRILRGDSRLYERPVP